jgi:hypothetical protein
VLYDVIKKEGRKKEKKRRKESFKQRPPSFCGQV